MSACHCALKEYDSAAADAEKCIGMKADWGKGYARKGAALHGLGQFDASIAAYEEGLKVEPGLEMLKKGLVAEHSYHFKVRPSASSLSLWLCCFREFSLGDCAAVWKTLGCAA